MPIYTYVRNTDPRNPNKAIILRNGSLILHVQTYANLANIEIEEIKSSGQYVIEAGIVYPATPAGGSSLGSPAAIIPPFSPEVLYKQFQAIQEEGKIYLADKDFISGETFTTENWTLASGGSGEGGITKKELEVAIQAAEEKASPIQSVHATVISTETTLTVNESYQLNGEPASFKAKLPVPAKKGQFIEAERIDATTNTVTIEGKIKGKENSTESLTIEKETKVWVSDSNKSWWPYSGRLSLSVLDKRYVRSKTKPLIIENEPIAAQVLTATGKESAEWKASAEGGGNVSSLLPLTISNTPAVTNLLEAQGEEAAKWVANPVGIVKEFVDFNAFFNEEGKRAGITSAEAATGKDAAPAIHEAMRKADTVTGSTNAFKNSPKGLVSCSEPQKYMLESTRKSPNAKPFAKIKSPYTAANVECCIIVPPVVGFGSLNDSNMILTIGTTVIKKCEEERKTSSYSCIGIGVEPDFGQNGHLVLRNITLDSTGNSGNWKQSKYPPPLPDGIYLGASGRYEGIVVNPEAYLRYGCVNGANHFQMHSCRFGGWARMAQTNWASEGAITGNNEFINCVWNGGWSAWYAESNCVITGVYIHGGWLGFGNTGPIFYKPVRGTKSGFINGMKLLECQIESGARGLMYSGEGDNSGNEGSIRNVTIENLQILGNAPMKNISPSDITVPPDAFIKGSTISNNSVKGDLLAQTGFYPGAAAIIGTEQVEENDWGECTTAIELCKFKNIPFILAPTQNGNKGFYVENGGRTRVYFYTTNAAVKEKSIVRQAAPVESGLSKLAVEPYNRATGTVAGRALQSRGAGEVVPVGTKFAAEPVASLIPTVNRLGTGKGEVGVIPPVPRGGSTKTKSIFELGSGTLEEHESPVVLFSANVAYGVLIVNSLSDFPKTNGIVSTLNSVISYRQAISKGTTTVFEGTLTKGKTEVVLATKSITGMAPREKITGIGIPEHTEIEFLDGENFILYLTKAATESGKKTLTTVATQNTFEGTLTDTSTRTTQTVNLTEITGTQTIKVESTEGFPEKNGLFIIAAGPKERYTASYTEKTSTSFKNCKLLKSATQTLHPQVVVTAEGVGGTNSRTRLYRSIEIEELYGKTITYEGAEKEIKSGESIEVSNGEELPISGRAIIKAEVEFSETQEIKKNVVSTLKFKNTLGLPSAGKLRFNNRVYTYTSKTETTVTGELNSATMTALEGEVASLDDPIELYYAKRTKAKLEELSVISTNITKISKGAKITSIKFSLEGGVVECESFYMPYRGLSFIRGKNYIRGVSSPIGGSIAAGNTITDITVLPINGAGFSSGPSGVVVSSVALSSITTFSYEKFISSNGESVAEGEEEVTENEGEGGTESEGFVSSQAGGYFIGVNNVEGNIGSGNDFTEGTILSELTKLGGSPASIKVDSSVDFPTNGIIKIGKNEGKYTGIIVNTSVFTGNITKASAIVKSISKTKVAELSEGDHVVGKNIPNTTVKKIISETEIELSDKANATVTGETLTATIGGGEITGLTWVLEGTNEYASGYPVVLWPHKQIEADKPVRVAYGSGREKIGDIGIVTTSGEGAVIGTSLTTDRGGIVEVVI